MDNLEINSSSSLYKYFAREMALEYSIQQWSKKMKIYLFFRNPAIPRKVTTNSFKHCG